MKCLIIMLVFIIKFKVVNIMFKGSKINFMICANLNICTLHFFMYNRFHLACFLLLHNLKVHYGAAARCLKLILIKEFNYYSSTDTFKFNIYYFHFINEHHFNATLIFKFSPSLLNLAK